MVGVPQRQGQNGFRSMIGGVYLLAAATVAAGILDLIWRGLDVGHQPIQASGIQVPGLMVLACGTAVWLIAAGLALLWSRTVRVGAIGTALVYGIFGLFSLPRLYTLPHKFGFHITLILGVVGELLQQFIVVAACMVLYVSVDSAASIWHARSQLVARWTFGLAGLLFGLAHFVNVNGPAHMIPTWMPFGGPFWVVLTGMGFVLAGIAILRGILDVLAARLLTLMLLFFETALVPLIVAHPRVHEAWGATAYNLAAAGAVWIFAVALAGKQESSAELNEKTCAIG